MLSNEEIASILWLIWKGCNTYIFQSCHQDPSKIIDHAITVNTSFLRWNSGTKRKKEQQTQLPSIWQTPVRGSLKINVGYSKLEGSPDCAIVGLVRNSWRVLIHNFTSSIYVESMMAVETLALLRCLQFPKEEALDRNVLRAEVLELESDNLTLVNRLPGADQGPWDTGSWSYD